jgi:hypothetical protein
MWKNEDNLETSGRSLIGVIYRQAYTRERAWKSTGDRLKRPCYLSRGDHNRKNRARKQRTDICKYSFINKKIKIWIQVPGEALATFPSKSHF